MLWRQKKNIGRNGEGYWILTDKILQVKPATLPIPIEIHLNILAGEVYGTQYQSGSFSLINAESVFSLPA